MEIRLHPFQEPCVFLRVGQWVVAAEDHSTMHAVANRALCLQRCLGIRSSPRADRAATRQNGLVFSFVIIVFEVPLLFLAM